MINVKAYATSPKIFFFSKLQNIIVGFWWKQNFSSQRRQLRSKILQRILEPFVAIKDLKIKFHKIDEEKLKTSSNPHLLFTKAELIKTGFVATHVEEFCSE